MYLDSTEEEMTNWLNLCFFLTCWGRGWEKLRRLCKARSGYLRNWLWVSEIWVQPVAWGVSCLRVRRAELDQGEHQLHCNCSWDLNPSHRNLLNWNGLKRDPICSNWIRALYLQMDQWGPWRVGVVSYQSPITPSQQYSKWAPQS